jgi:hypothetical protein
MNVGGDLRAKPFGTRQSVAVSLREESGAVRPKSGITQRECRVSKCDHGGPTLYFGGELTNNLGAVGWPDPLALVERRSRSVAMHGIKQARICLQHAQTDD